jgi:NADPH-dependent glutamate synthase beta subunit-like oxidoreductase/NAD(P)H-flavin reductase
MAVEAGRAETPPKIRPERDVPLGAEGFTYQDLHREDRLAALDAVFLRDLRASNAALADRLVAYRRDPKALTPLELSALLVETAPKLSAFLARLFGIEREWRAQVETAAPEAVLFRCRRDFIQRRAMKAELPEGFERTDPAPWISRARSLESLFSELPWIGDRERANAMLSVELIDLESAYVEVLKQNKHPEVAAETRARVRALRAAAAQHPDLFDSAPTQSADSPEGELAFLENLLSFAARWFRFRRLHPALAAEVRSWVIYRLPEPFVFASLVETERPSPDLKEERVGPAARRRRRDGFKLTDRRMSRREVIAEAHYCLICHDREKDSCSKGFFEQKTGTFQKNPLGISLKGCPLDEKISEMHLMRQRGDSIAALALVALDNPMCPGTGHRICNDCMKGCIFQKQDPVNIPQIETGVLTDVFALPWGFEIWSLLTRWNPLSADRPYSLPYNGKNVLVVGLGPAGYTLAHYLVNEGFGVVGIDGLKIEPLRPDWTGADGGGVSPIRDIGQLFVELDERPLAGFGGVSEYGITVRWDKNFLTAIYLNLARRTLFRCFGGVRFGGTITAAEAFEMGFDHVAIAAGAGRPTIIGMKNNVIRGIRKASDFLMALQLTGAFKKEALANLQMELPAVVIGGGLTAIDTATELLAYYPLQVEKMLHRYETLCRRLGEPRARAAFDQEEREILDRMLRHGFEVREERKRAASKGEQPDFASLCKSWGGVAIVYRRKMEESPAYRLNHEEIIKALEEGISFIEGLDPEEALADEWGKLKAVRFRRGGSGEILELPARTCLVAAGTTPNITYEKEHPGTFPLDEKKRFFAPHRAIRQDGEWKLVPARQEEPGAFFTGAEHDGRFVTFFGDNHPEYNGNVVKAMASARDGYRAIREIFRRDVEALRHDDQPARNSRWRDFAEDLGDRLTARVVAVERLTPTIGEVIVRAPQFSKAFRPGQFFRLQNMERHAPRIAGTPLLIEPLALTGAWVDGDRGLLSMIALEIGVSSRVCSALRPGEPVIVMGPTGTPTEIPENAAVALCGGGLGNAVLFSIGRACRERGNRVVYFAGYKKAEDFYKREEIEAGADVVVYSVDRGEPIAARRPQDKSFVGNIVQAMLAYARGDLGETPIRLSEVQRLIAIGSDRMMSAVAHARHDVLAEYLSAAHIGIGSINSPMQCMMKEVCAQCLQKHVDPATGKEKEVVFSCFNQDQKLDEMDWKHLAERLRQNTVQEKLANLWLDHLLEIEDPRVI